LTSSILSVRALKKYFPVQKSFIERLVCRQTRWVRAVDGIDLDIAAGEVLGLVGESGSGKTTVGNLVLRLIEPTSGSIVFDGIDILSLKSDKIRKLRRDMQMIFQDPYASLDPRRRIGDIVADPLRIHDVASGKETKSSVLSFLDEVGLTPAESFYDKYPYELSGGQRQRIALARSVITRPKFIVADEPTSMLDVSVNAQILNLMLRLKERFNLTYLFITHDVATAKYICDWIAVMYLGEIVEKGPFEEVIRTSHHPYTIALLSAIPMPDPKLNLKLMAIKGEVPSAINPPEGCRFHPRCPYREARCVAHHPPLVKISDDHYSACLRANELRGEAEKFLVYAKS